MKFGLVNKEQLRIRGGSGYFEAGCGFTMMGLPAEFLVKNKGLF